jgi:hypothetical protein
VQVAQRVKPSSQMREPLFYVNTARSLRQRADERLFAVYDFVCFCVIRVYLCILFLNFPDPLPRYPGYRASSSVCTLVLQGGTILGEK